MVQLSEIDAQLTKLGSRKTFLRAPEIRQIQHILMDGERIIKFVSGRYQGRFAGLVATPIRLLLIDKKPLHLTVDDIRYNMIAEIDVWARVFDVRIVIYTASKQHSFTSIRQRHLRSLAAYVKKRVKEIRHYDKFQEAELGPTNSQTLFQTPAARTRLPAPGTHHVIGTIAVEKTHAPRF